MAVLWAAWSCRSHALLKRGVLQSLGVGAFILMATVHLNLALLTIIIVPFMTYLVSRYGARVIAWADALLKKYPHRRAIVTSFSVMKPRTSGLSSQPAICPRPAFNTRW